MKAFKSGLKRAAGRQLFRMAEAMPFAKPWIKDFGLRASKEWCPMPDVRAQTPDGRHIALRSVRENYLSFELFWRGAGYYEPITTLLLTRLVEPENVFLDVGANIGFFTLMLSAAKPGLRVCAFEPNPTLFAMLEENVRANGLSRVVCEPLAISSNSGRANLFLSPSQMSASLRSDFEGNAEAEIVEVGVVSLDAYLRASRPRGTLVLKVDVEGHESDFIEGAYETLGDLKPDLVLEAASDCREETLRDLRFAGYRFYPITSRGFQESDRLTPVVRGRHVFLNYLVSVRPPDEIRDLFAAIQPAVDRIDLDQTSKLADPENLRRIQERAGLAEGEDGARVAAGD